MSEATKRKLHVGFGIDEDTADKLEAAGILLPKDIKNASDKTLKEAGLSDSKITALRVKLPKAK